MGGAIHSDTRLFSPRDTQAVKGVAILLMVWHHLFGFPQYFPYETLLPFNLAYYVGQFGKICVALYLFLSGYGMTVSAEAEPKPLWRVTLSRLRRFYTSYWLYFAICTPYGLLVLREGRFAPDLPLFLMNLAGYINYNNGYDVAWWFVSVYIPLLLLFPLLYRLSVREPLLIGALALAGIGIQTRMWAGALPGSFFLWQSPFLVGILFARLKLYETAWAARAAEKPLVWHGAVLAILFLYRFHAAGNCSTDYVIAPIAAFSLACAVRKLRAQRIMAFLGALSLPIWLTHGFLCFGYAQAFIYAPRYPILIFPLLLAVNIPLVWCIERFHRWAAGIPVAGGGAFRTPRSV